MKAMYNPKFKKTAVLLSTGEYFLSDEDIIMQTILGSCLSVCLYSDWSPWCAMNHFMLPGMRAHGSAASELYMDAGYYGMHAMELMINGMLKQGIRKEFLKAKIFGGGAVLKGLTHGIPVGEQNISFVTNFLNIERIPIISCSVGGDYARRILFFTSTKEVLLWRVEKQETNQVAEEEIRFREKIAGQPHKADITFFS